MRPANAHDEFKLYVLLVNPDLAIFAATNSFANDLFDYIAVCLEHGLQLAEVAGARLKKILNGFVLNEAPTWFAVDEDRKSDAPVLTILNRARWEFDVHGNSRVVEKAIVA